MAIASALETHFLLAVVPLTCAWILYEVLFSPLRHIRGPVLARFTNFYRSGLTLTGKVDEDFRKWHRQWGTAVRVGTNVVSISDPGLIRVIYATKNAWLKVMNMIFSYGCHSDGVQSTMYRPNDVVVEGQRIPNIFNTSDKAFHAKYSTPIRGFWSLTKILELEPLMDETLRQTLSILGTRFADTKHPCMMDEWLTYYAWDFAAQVSFGKPYGFLEEGRDVGGMIAESFAGLRYFSFVSQNPWIDECLDKNPIWRIGPRPLVNGFNTTIRLITEYQNGLTTGGNAHAKEVDHFLARYYTLRNTVDIADDRQIINWIMLNVLAGGDSTAGALRSFVYHIARNQSSQKALANELDNAKLPLPAQWRDIKDLSYLNAAVLESQRLTPAVGLILEREAPAGGFELPDGRVIPAGTKVGINPCVVTRDVGVFGEDVETYRPERWLRGENESKDAFAYRYNRMFEATDLMYGAGNRVCMGKHLAKVGMYKLFATLYSVFDVSPP